MPSPHRARTSPARVRPRPATHKSSTYTAWLSRINVVDSLCCQSRRVSATRACARATFTTAFLRLFEPFCLRDRACCSRLSLRAARRRNFGAATFVPSDITAKWVRPRSIPISASTGGKVSSWLLCTTNEAKYRPAASRMIATLDGSDGSVRDQRTGDVADLRQPQPAVVKHREPGVLREPDGLAVVLARPEPGRGHRAALAFARDRGEEVAVRGVQIGQGLLQHHGRHLAQPCREPRSSSLA